MQGRGSQVIDTREVHLGLFFCSQATSSDLQARTKGGERPFTTYVNSQPSNNRPYNLRQVHSYWGARTIKTSAKCRNFQDEVGYNCYFSNFVTRVSFSLKAMISANAEGMSVAGVSTVGSETSRSACCTLLSTPRIRSSAGFEEFTIVYHLSYSFAAGILLR